MQDKKFKQLWGMPLLLAILILFGLLSALLGTGIWHWLSWTALCIPLAVLIYFLKKRK